MGAIDVVVAGEVVGMGERVGEGGGAVAGAVASVRVHKGQSECVGAVAIKFARTIEVANEAAGDRTGKDEVASHVSVKVDIAVEVEVTIRGKVAGKGIATVEDDAPVTVV